MQEVIDSLQDRVAPAEAIFFTWLPRVVIAATLVGCAWIDDAPPLELASWVIGLYVAARVATQFGALMTAAPFQHPVLRVAFALLCLVLLGFAFIVVAVFVERVALSAVQPI